jgi:hypothetical protein
MSSSWYFFLSIVLFSAALFVAPLAGCGPVVEVDESAAAGGSGGSSALSPGAPAGDAAADPSSLSPCGVCCRTDDSECSADPPVGVYCPSDPSSGWKCIEACASPPAAEGDACKKGIPCACAAGLACLSGVTVPKCAKEPKS